MGKSFVWFYYCLLGGVCGWNYVFVEVRDIGFLVSKNFNGVFEVNGLILIIGCDIFYVDKMNG